MASQVKSNSLDRLSNSSVSQQRKHQGFTLPALCAGNPSVTGGFPPTFPFYDIIFCYNLLWLLCLRYIHCGSNRFTLQSPHPLIVNLRPMKLPSEEYHWTLLMKVNIGSGNDLVPSMINISTATVAFHTSVRLKSSFNQAIIARWRHDMETLFALLAPSEQPWKKWVIS